MLELDVSKLIKKDGVRNDTSKLDTLYLENTHQSAYTAHGHENFENFQRSPGMNMKDFISKT